MVVTDVASPRVSVCNCIYLWNTIFGEFFYLNVIGHASDFQTLSDR